MAENGVVAGRGSLERKAQNGSDGGQEAGSSRESRCLKSRQGEETKKGHLLWGGGGGGR